MEEGTWYRKQRSQMEETLWAIAQKMRTLEEYRRENRKRWDDEASQDINRRYLNPHEEDCQQMLQLLNDQHHSLEQADRQLDEAYQHSLEINRLSEELNRLLEFARQDMQLSYSDYQVYQENQSAAQSQLPKIQGLLNRANNACE